MGVTFTLILAHEDDLEKTLIWMGFPEPDMIFTKILDPVTMAEVHGLVLNSEYEATVDLYSESVLEVSEDGPWITLIPDEFISGLARLEDVERQRIAHLWLDTQHISFIKLPNAESFMQELLKDMQILAIRALLENKKLYLRSAL